MAPINKTDETWYEKDGRLKYRWPPQGESKSLWTPAEMKAFLLEICENPRPKEVPDLDKSECGNLKWEEMSPLDDYFPSVDSEAEVYARTFCSFLRSWNLVRTNLYGIYGKRVYRPLLAAQEVEALLTYSNFTELVAAVKDMVVEYQEAKGFREE
jgi:hypothetical protein